MWLVQPHPVTASEILTKAAAADNVGPITEAKTLRYSSTVRYRNPGATEFTEGQIENWVKAPDASRAETTFRAPDGTEWGGFTGRSKEIRYIYERSPHLLLMYSADSYRDQFNTLADLMQAVSEIGDQNVYDVVLIGQEPVDGRMTYIVEAKVKPGFLADPDRLAKSHRLTEHQAKLWIDQQLYVTLRYQAWNEDGDLVNESQIEDLQINPVLDDAIFNFAAPSGATTLDMRSAASGGVVETLEQIATKSPTKIFSASHSPDQLEATKPHFDMLTGITSFAYVDNGEEMAGEVKYPRIMVLQGPPSALSTSTLGEGRHTQIGPYSGQLYSKDQESSLVFERDGTRIIIRSFNGGGGDWGSGRVDSAIAESLQPMIKK